MTTYKDSGVDVELGDEVSEILYNAAKKTWDNRKKRLGEIIVPFDDFTGVRAIKVANLPEGTLMNIGFDGVGTKIEIAERMNDHSTVAYDLIAMVVDDAVVRGAEPVLVGSILDVNSLKKDGKPHLIQVRQLAGGYIAAAFDADVIVVTGETAELGDRVRGYGPFNYNWGAAVVWFAKEDRLFTGKKIEVGDRLIALREEGLRSNGLSLTRRVLQDKHGEDWHDRSIDGVPLGRSVLKPSKIYCKAVCEMFGGYDREPKAAVHGVAHITGGGLPGKLGRVLKPSGLGARIDNPFTPPWIMQYCQQVGDVSDREAYAAWNMGQGMVIITPDENRVMDVAAAHGIKSRVIGTVTQEPGIAITSAGYHSPGKSLEY